MIQILLDQSNALIILYQNTCAKDISLRKGHQKDKDKAPLSLSQIASTGNRLAWILLIYRPNDPVFMAAEDSWNDEQLRIRKKTKQAMLDQMELVFFDARVDIPRLAACSRALLRVGGSA